MQKVAEITPPLRPRVGFAARGSTSTNEFFLCRPGEDKLIRRRISWCDFAPEAASLGDCAMEFRRLAMSWVKYEGSPVLLAELYSPRPIPGVTGTFVREGRRPGWPVSWAPPGARGAGDSARSAPWSENFCAMVSDPFRHRGGRMKVKC
jgi:hypothetical protein